SDEAISIRRALSGPRQGEGAVDKVYCVYILTNQRNTVLYTGVTGDLGGQVHQHQEKLLPGFTNRYNVSKLVYYEAGYDASAAIAREKQIKAGSRRRRPASSTGSIPNGAICTMTCNEIASLRWQET